MKSLGTARAARRRGKWRANIALREDDAPRKKRVLISWLALAPEEPGQEQVRVRVRVQAPHPWEALALPELVPVPVLAAEWSRAWEREPREASALQALAAPERAWAARASWPLARAGLAAWRTR